MSCPLCFGSFLPLHLRMKTDVFTAADSFAFPKTANFGGRIGKLELRCAPQQQHLLCSTGSCVTPQLLVLRDRSLDLLVCSDKNGWWSMPLTETGPAGQARAVSGCVGFCSSCGRALLGCA